MACTRVSILILSTQENVGKISFATVCSVSNKFDRCIGYSTGLQRLLYILRSFMCPNILESIFSPMVYFVIDFSWKCGIKGDLAAQVNLLSEKCVCLRIV